MLAEAVRKRFDVTNPWFVLALAVVAQFGVSIVDQGLPLLAGFVKADLDLSAALTGLAVSSFAFGKIFGSYAAGVAAVLRRGPHIGGRVGDAGEAWELAGAAVQLGHLGGNLITYGDGSTYQGRDWSTISTGESVFVQDTIDTRDLWNSAGAATAFTIMYKATSELLDEFDCNAPQHAVRVALISRGGKVTWDHDF